MKTKWGLAIVLTGGIMGLVLSGCSISTGLKKKPVPLSAPTGGPERTPIYRASGWTIARAAMHNHTTYSDGCRSAEDLLELAGREGMAILSYNDHREGKICGGKHQLVCGKVNGIESVGYAAYFEHLRRIQGQAQSRGMIVLKGLEVIPYFYNYGKSPHLVLDGLQAHFTVYGVEDPAVFKQMPVRNTITFKPEPIPDEKPWAKFVDYLVEQGAIVHAVHVEEGADMWYGPAHGACPPVPQNLHRLKNLTGFSVLPYAWHEQTGGPGGLWDTDLLEYQAGLRRQPLWAMADADYHCESSLAIATTLFYLREFSEPDIYQALREGRMVALQGDAFQNTYVAEWWVSDREEPAERIMLGRSARLAGAPVVRFALDHPVPECRVRLIRNGSVILDQPGTEFTYRDQEQGSKREPAFYRVEVSGPRANRGDYDGPTMPASELFVNPIFIRFSP